MARETVAEYNGWANYPTWAINLWLDNDPGWDWGAVRSGDALRDIVSEMLEDGTGTAGMGADLLGWALGFVDFDEIVRVHLTDNAADDIGEWLPLGVIQGLHGAVREFDHWDRAFAGHLLRVPNARLAGEIERTDIVSLVVVRVRGRARVYVSENYQDFLRVI